LPCQGKAALFESYIWNAIPKNKTHPSGWVLFFWWTIPTASDLPLEKRKMAEQKKKPNLSVELW
jgi:hypothetical protein